MNNIYKEKMKKYVLLAFFLFSINTFYGWGQKGHRVVVDIAFKNMSSRAKRNMDRNILNHNLLIDKSNYPDDIKGDTTGKYSKYSELHFLDIENDNLSKEQVKEFLEKDTIGNAYNAIVEFFKKLETNKKDTFALSFLIHLIGDIHQPLHLGRKSDQGGNLIKVHWFGISTNLHSVWDQGIIDSEGYSQSEMTNLIINTYNKSGRVDKLNYKNPSEDLLDWIYETYKKRVFIYNNYYYIVDNNYNRSYSYYYYNRSTVNEQLYKAGMRLASILNYLYN